MIPIIKVKICGIRSLEEARWAVDAGADALGFIFVPKSKRYIKPQTVQAITAKLPPFVNKVGVFAGESPAKVAEIVRQCTLDTIQLHGGEDLLLYQEIPATKIQVISFSSEVRNFQGETPKLTEKKEILSSFPLKNEKTSLHGILLDSTHQGQTGGTGVPLPWQDSTFQRFLHAVKDTGYPIILAGGLNPENILAAIKYTRPYGVDVSSGVEHNGRKDRELIHRFVSQVKNNL